MKKSTRNMLIAGGVAFIGFSALAAIHNYSSRYLMKFALDREGPKKTEKEKEKIMSLSDFSEILENAMNAASELESTQSEEIEIEAFDGITLVGHWYCPENPKRVIVAMHGWRSSWSQDFGLIAPFMFENDCAVLFAEQRAQGKSGGEYMGFGLLERYDCLSWINWVNERTEMRLPMYLCGISMGGTTVLMASGFELPENVKGIISDCAFTSPHAIWKHVVENNFHLPYGIYNAAARDLCKKKILFGSDSYSTLEAVKNSEKPILFIHGTDDHFVPIEMTYENYKACTSEKRLFVVPGADHAISYVIDKEGYEQTVKSFWQDLEKDI